MPDPFERLSKRLSYLLRHNPAAVGVNLSRDGWIDLDRLIDAMNAHGDSVTIDDVADVLATSRKQRFEVEGDRIRAAQGHSIPVDLGLPPNAPPEVLFHGTVARFVPAIRREGLVRGSRTHVHLSPNAQTAVEVGRRRGAPVVLTVQAQAMARDGHVFFQAVNRVWLTSQVPPQYIDFEPD